MDFDFWDIDVEKRAQLTEEQVRSYLEVELMKQGVIRPEQPEFEDETAPSVPTTTYYEPSESAYKSAGFAFNAANWRWFMM